jgi:hypothetical protein
MSDSSTSADPKAGSAPKPDKPENPELVAIKSESAIVAEQLVIAQNRQKMLAMIVPSDLKPPEGTLKVDGDHPMESQILAYRSLNQAANAIAAKVLEAKPTQVLIHADADVSALFGLQAFMAQLDLIEAEFDKDIQLAKTALADAKTVADGQLLAQAAGFMLAPMVIGTVIRSAVDLLAMFRTDITLKYKDLTIGDLALVAAVSGCLCEHIPVYNPTLLSPHPFDMSSAIVKRLEDLTGLQRNLENQQTAVANLQARLKQQIDELSDQIKTMASATPLQNSGKTERDRIKRQEQFDRLAAVNSNLSTAIISFANLKAGLLKSDDASGMNALTKIIRAEKFKAAAGTNSHILVLKMAAAGGGFQTKKKALGSTDISYSGGSIVEAFLFDPTGKIAYAATLPFYTGFVSVKEREERAVNLQNVEP